MRNTHTSTPAPANSPPSFSAGHSIQSLGYNAPAESTIWHVDCLTGAVTGQWTNVDGSKSNENMRVPKTFRVLTKFDYSSTLNLGFL